jgi:caa(3)-type oxidase subunit IV
MSEHAPSNYVKIWGWLVVLLVISVIGPFLGNPVVTLVTAFGIAGIKAFLVIKHFMHLNLQKPFVSYLLATALVFMVLLFAGTAPDVMKSEGKNWRKPVEGWQVEGAGADHHAGDH